MPTNYTSELLAQEEKLEKVVKDSNAFYTTDVDIITKEIKSYLLQRDKALLEAMKKDLEGWVQQNNEYVLWKARPEIKGLDRREMVDTEKLLLLLKDYNPNLK